MGDLRAIQRGDSRGEIFFIELGISARAGLISRGLGAKTAIVGASAAPNINYRAKFNFVAEARPGKSPGARENFLQTPRRETTRVRRGLYFETRIVVDHIFTGIN